MFLESHGFVAMPVTICIEKTCSNYPYLISEWRRNYSTLCAAQQQNRDSQEHVTKYKHMRKYTVEFLRKLENRGIKIVQDNLIRNTKSINLF